MTSRRGSVFLIVVLLAVINLPLLHSAYYERKIASEGIDVQATVVENRELPPDDDPAYLLQFEFDDTIDPDQQGWLTAVDEATYAAAVDSSRLPVRVLPDDPSAYRVPGQVEGSLGLWIAMAANLVVVGIALLLRWRSRDAGTRGSLPGVAPRTTARILATSDVERCKPGGGLVQLDGLVHEVTGEVCGIDDDGLMLDLGDRRVRVELDGHANPVGYQQPARVTGLLLDS